MTAPNADLAAMIEGTIAAYAHGMRNEDRTQRSVLVAHGIALAARIAEAVQGQVAETFQDGWDAHEAHLAMHCEPAKVNFPTMLRKMWSGGEVQSWLDKLPPMYTHPAAAPQPPAATAGEAVAWVNESYRDDMIARKGSVYWHAPMMCGKEFKGAFPVYLLAVSKETGE